MVEAVMLAVRQGFVTVRMKEIVEFAPRGVVPVTEIF
jgi:hypothetical protein